MRTARRIRRARTAHHIGTLAAHVTNALELGDELAWATRELRFATATLDERTLWAIYRRSSLRHQARETIRRNYVTADHGRRHRLDQEHHS